MKKEITLICKEAPEKLPPVITAAICLRDCGCKVRMLVSSVDKQLNAHLDSYGIECTELLPETPLPRSVVGKIAYWRKFKNAARKTLAKTDGDAYLWICSGDTALALKDILHDRKYTLHLHELYDRYPFYKKRLERYAKNAEHVIVPDNARAVIFRYWYNLETTPVVIPNKPFFEELDKRLEDVSPANYALLQRLKSKKIILYQAKMIRMKLFDVAEALKQLGDEYVLGLLGDIRDTQMVDELLKRYDNVVHFEYMIPPYHLLLTREARIGILTYNYESLNNIFCAPNKVWEYSKFGIPMLANNLPVLKMQLESFRAGACYEFNDPESIKRGIRTIEDSYDEYKAGSSALYASVNMRELYRSILDKDIFKNG